MAIEQAVVNRLRAKIDEGDVPFVREFLRDNPDYLQARVCSESILHYAAGEGFTAIVAAILDAGQDVNAPSSNGVMAIERAVDDGRCETVGLLLERGADPRLGRPMVGAIVCKTPGMNLPLVRLLVEHGADVNQRYPTFGNCDKCQTALDWALLYGRQDVAEYLRSLGARTEAELQAAVAAPPGPGPTPVPAKSPSPAREVVDWFATHVGPVRPQALVEIVPTTEPPVAVHVVPSAADRPHVTLFTTGLSAHAMRVPPGEEDYRFAELSIQLPPDWPLTKTALAGAEHGWPLRWLRKIARYPAANDTWLGGPATIIANDDPPKPLAAGCPFTCLLLLGDQSLRTADGRTVRLYRLVPLYTEERALELKQGLPALMQALDRHGISFVVDLNRRNVGRKK